MASDALIKAGREQGYSERTLRRARAALDVEPYRADNAWLVRLPDEAEQP